MFTAIFAFLADVAENVFAAWGNVLAWLTNNMPMGHTLTRPLWIADVNLYTWFDRSWVWSANHVALPLDKTPGHGAVVLITYTMLTVALLLRVATRTGDSR